jgi:acyl-CoA synthetase (AMP-forming)/AMP-acid ligase II
LPPSAETKTLEIRPAPESLSYAFWYEEIARVAGGLTALGLRHGDRWLSSCRTGSKTASLHWACQLAGIVVTPLNWRIKPEELDYCLADADAAALVFDDVAADTVAGAAAVQRLPRIAIGNVDGTFVCMPRFDAAKDGASACARAPPARRRDTCAGSRQINGRLVNVMPSASIASAMICDPRAHVVSRAALPSSSLASSTWIPMTSTMCRRRIAKCASLIGFMACPTLMLLLVRSTQFAGRIDPRKWV